MRCSQLVSLTEAVGGEALVLDGGSWHFSWVVSCRDGGRPGGRLTVGELQETEICEGDSQRSASFSEKHD